MGCARRPARLQGGGRAALHRARKAGRERQAREDIRERHRRVSSRGALVRGSASRDASAERGRPGPGECALGEWRADGVVPEAGENREWREEDSVCIVPI